MTLSNRARLYKLLLLSRFTHHNLSNMSDNTMNTAKNIAVSVAGSVGGNKVADKLHLGGAGHIALGVTGGILAGDAEQKVENKN